MTIERSLRLALSLFVLAPVATTQTTIFEIGAQPPSDDSKFGHAVSGTEDVNGDGIGDFLIADPADSSFDGGAGCVRVFSGSDGALLRIAYGEKNDALGRALCGLGDVDGDGRGDYAVGLRNPASVAFGKIRVYSGLSGAPIWEIVGPDYVEFGVALAAAGDLNGDGATDLLVPVDTSSGTGQLRRGVVWVVSGATGEVLWRTAGFSNLSTVQSTRAKSAGDVDGDGVPDIMVSSAGPADQSILRVISGATGGVLHSFAGSLTGTGTGNYYYVGDGAGDWNGDGFADFAILFVSYHGGPVLRTEVRVISGASGGVLHTLDTITPGERAFEVVNVGDADGDGLHDLAVSVVRETWPIVIWRTRVYAGGSGAVMTEPDREIGGMTQEDLPALAAAGDVNGDGLGDVIVGVDASIVHGSIGVVTVFSPIRLELGDTIPCSECPCDNDTPLAAKTGCANSTGVGAKLRAYGAHLFFNDNLELELTQTLPGSPVIFMQSPWGVQSSTPFPSDGVLCLLGPARIGVAVADGAGQVLFPYSSNWVYSSSEFFQCWYRDSTAGPCGTGNNYSNVVRVLTD